MIETRAGLRIDVDGNVMERGIGPTKIFWQPQSTKCKKDVAGADGLLDGQLPLMCRQQLSLFPFAFMAIK